MNREDIYALQTKTGAYILRREPVTDELISRHLTGRITCGWYALDTKNSCRWAVVDSDQPNGLADLQKLWQEFTRFGLPAYLEESARGGHLWVFTQEPISARPLRRMAIALVEQAEIGPAEVYPKQANIDHAAGRVGSLVRGPLGVHRKVDKRFGFLNPATLESIGLLPAQLDYIMSIQCLTPMQIADTLATLWEEQRQEKPDERPSLPRRTGTIAELKERIGDIYTFISQYVELDEYGRGHCPFHPPDVHPSFAVNREGKYWVCFHEVNPRTGRYIGGDAIEFYRKLRGITTREAARELAERVL